MRVATSPVKYYGGHPPSPQSYFPYNICYYRLLFVKARLCRARPPCPPAPRRPAAGHLPPLRGKPPPAGGRGRQWPAAGQAFAAGGFGGAGRAASPRTPPTPSLLQSYSGRPSGRPNGRQMQKKTLQIVQLKKYYYFCRAG